MRLRVLAALREQDELTENLTWAPGAAKTAVPLYRPELVVV